MKRKSGYFIPFSLCAKKDSALILEWMGTSTHFLVLHVWLRWNQQKYSARVPPHPLEQWDGQDTEGLSTTAQLAEWVSKIPHYVAYLEPLGRWEDMRKSCIKVAVGIFLMSNAFSDNTMEVELNFLGDRVVEIYCSWRWCRTKLLGKWWWYFRGIRVNL